MRKTFYYIILFPTVLMASAAFLLGMYALCVTRYPGHTLPLVMTFVLWVAIAFTVAVGLSWLARRWSV